MKTQHKLALSAGLLTMAVPMAADAEVLVRYEFNSNSAAQTSGSLSGGNVAAPVDSIAANAVEAAVGRTADTLANAITANDYAGFVLTNNSGQDAELETMTFDWWFNSPNASGTQYYRVHGLSDVNGFIDGQEFGTRELGEGSTPGVSFNAHDSAAEALNVSFDISSLGTLADGEAIEFRVYLVDNRSGTFSPDQLIDNITINGTLVPEPGSLALLGLGTLLVARRRR